MQGGGTFPNLKLKVLSPEQISFGGGIFPNLKLKMNTKFLQPKLGPASQIVFHTLRVYVCGD